MYTMQSRVSGFLKENPATNLVVSRTGAGPIGTAAGVQAAGKKPGEVIVVGYDLLPSTVEQIKNGYVTIVLDQHPCLQGYLPVVQFYMIKEFAMRTWNVNTGVGFVDNRNIDQVSILVSKCTR